MSEKIPLMLKCLSTTRWSCRWKRAKAVYELTHNVRRALLELKEEKNPKVYRERKAMLGAICDLTFPVGLLVLKTISF